MPTGKAKKIASPKPAAANKIRFNPRQMIIVLADGRELAVPLSFYPTLAKATPAQRAKWEIFGSGSAIAWDELDLHLSVEYLLAGAREGIPKPPPMSTIFRTKKSA